MECRIEIQTRGRIKKIHHLILRELCNGNRFYSPGNTWRWCRHVQHLRFVRLKFNFVIVRLSESSTPCAHSWIMVISNIHCITISSLFQPVRYTRLMIVIGFTSKRHILHTFTRLQIERMIESKIPWKRTCISKRPVAERNGLKRFETETRFKRAFGRE